MNAVEFGSGSTLVKPAAKVRRLTIGTFSTSITLSSFNSWQIYRFIHRCYMSRRQTNGSNLFAIGCRYVVQHTIDVLLVKAECWFLRDFLILICQMVQRISGSLRT